MGILFIFLILIVVAILGCALLLQFSAQLAGVRDATFIDAVKIIIYTAIVDTIASLILGAFGLSLLGGIIGLLIAINFIARYFSLSYSKAIVVWAVNVVVWIGIILLLVFFITGSVSPTCL